MSVSRRLRFEILRRDGSTCRYCGAQAPDATLTVDHVIPVALGGGDEPNNLVTACVDCNGGKSSINPDSALVEDVDAAALLFAKAIEEAAKMRRAKRVIVDEQIAAFEEMWSAWTYGAQDLPIPRDDNWVTSIERFYELGLDRFDWEPLVRQAMNNVAVAHSWRSFCRRCWDEISARQELARQLIEDGDV